MAIEATEYEATRVRLTRDPVVQSMALGCLATDPAEMKHPGGGATHDFMLAALREYADRAGHPAGCHIGGVAEAILRLLDMPEADWPTPDEQQLQLPRPANAADLAQTWRERATTMRVRGHRQASASDREAAALSFAKAEQLEADAAELDEHLGRGMTP